ncbi:MAG: MerR family transcriptional regulator [Prevotellaceae bacterium]|jgi:DNA-binding transcriptional MerR regulator|nr:MerR family transcriptional regulator [Prevotellaceae bacterium]
MTKKPLKLYYSIGEVSAMTDVKETTLRFWEKKFPQLAPRRATGRIERQYTDADIALVKQIRYLVKERGLSTTAAEQHLRVHKAEVEVSAEVCGRLEAVRDELLSIKRALDGFSYSQVEQLGTPSIDTSL